VNALEVTADVVVPVYNAAHDVQRCVESVLAHTTGDYRLILIDDASTDPGVAGYLATLRARGVPQIVILGNERNLGFTLTANRGMREARAGVDVVLLNSDTVVTEGWLDALVRCAQSDQTIGTITPFSNNAEICSLPRFCENNAWPEGVDPEPMAQALRAAATPVYPDLPTGVGFCLYIRRSLLDEIGDFDPVFGLGYGEENDFCMRATAAGYRNVLCDDAFVVHTGGSSFGDKRSALSSMNSAILLERHPSYDALVRNFIAADPLKPLRELALAHYRIATEGRKGVLHVIHGHGGGTEYHVRSLISAAGTAYRHFLLIAVGDVCHLEEHADGVLRSYEFVHAADETWSDFLGGLCARFEIALVHLHNISGGRDGIAEALATLDVAYGYTVHDLSFACPTITFINAGGAYCGAVTDRAVCARCLAAQPEFAAIDIGAWRDSHGSLLEGASFVIAPSQWAANTLHRYFPRCPVEVVEHALTGGMTRPDAVEQPQPMPDDGRPIVAVLGAIGPDKGSRRLERMVELTRERALPLRWVLIGYLDSGRDPSRSADGVFTMHGPYDSRSLPALFDAYRVDVVAYPSVCPETYSFTLSESWAAGRPAIVPPIGALADRVAASAAGWVLDEGEWRSESRMLERIAAIVAEPARGARDAAAARARATLLPTPEAMAQRTLRLYATAIDAFSKRSRAGADGAVAATGVSGATRAPARPIAARRCLDALGYRPWRSWQPGVDDVQAQASAAPADALARFARAALRIRHTATGRLLYSLAPKALVDALKARLTA